MKSCSKCGETKPLEDFPLSGGGRRRRDCKACHSAQVKALYAGSPEVRRAHVERQRRYWAEDPEKMRERVRRTRDPVKHVARNVKWAQANPEKVNAYKRKWAEANPEAGRDRTRKRRARRLEAFVEEVRFEDILIRDVGTCGICGQPIMDNLIELDHVIPLAAGGTHEPNNVQIAHRSCNRRKATKIAA